MSREQSLTVEGVLRRHFPSTFGANVRRVRKLRGMRQKQLAHRLGIAQSIVSNRETDRCGLPEGQTLLRYATVLACSVEALLVGIDHTYDIALVAQLGPELWLLKTELAQVRDLSPEARASARQAIETVFAREVVAS